MSRILFVDDDPFTLETLSRAAQVLGHEALLAHSGAEALQVAESETPDMMFVDLHLTDMDGLQVVRALRRFPELSDKPILVLSAGADLEFIQQVRSAGAQDYIHKPIRLQTLLDLIRQHTEV